MHNKPKPVPGTARVMKHEVSQSGFVQDISEALEQFEAEPLRLSEMYEAELLARRERLQTSKARIRVKIMSAKDQVHLAGIAHAQAHRALMDAEANLRTHQNGFRTIDRELAEIDGRLKHYYQNGNAKPTAKKEQKKSKAQKPKVKPSKEDLLAALKGMSQEDLIALIKEA